MMRGRRHMAVACRAPSGEIVVHAEPVTGGVYGTGWAKLPFLRGTIMIWDTLSLGMRALMCRLLNSTRRFTGSSGWRVAFNYPRRGTGCPLGVGPSRPGTVSSGSLSRRGSWTLLQEGVGQGVVGHPS